MRYLTFREILLIHSIVLDETGGRHGLRNRDIILSLAVAPRQKVFGEELYPTVFLKAAAYTHHIIMYHPFIDGNKRTAMTTAFTFLQNNNEVVKAKHGAIENFALEIVINRLDIPTIGRWLKKQTRP